MIEPSLSTRLRVAAVFALLACGARAEMRVIPPPTFDESRAPDTSVAVLAGGCFWGVQGVFQHVDGVLAAVSGYAGGDRATASYEVVGTGTTGHAETVRVTYDRQKITYGELLRIYFSVAHDPTEINRQGPDRGPQYRSTIFPVDAAQRAIAERYVAELEAANVFRAPIATTFEEGKTFYPAETYHQDFLTRHPELPYVVINDLPKVRALASLYPKVYRTEPVLVLHSLTSPK